MTPPRRLLLLTIVCLLAGAGLTWAGLWVTALELLPLSTWVPDQEGLSNYEEVRVWGWPLAGVIDHPSAEQRDRMDLPAEARTGALLGDWLLLSLGVAHLLALIWLLSGRRDEVPAPSPTAPATRSLLFASLLAPYSTFVVVQALLPIGFLLNPIEGGGFDKELRLATTLAVAAVVAAYVAMLVLGLPICFVLRRTGRFSLRYLATIGAVAGTGPFLPGILASIGSLIVSAGAASGGLNVWPTTLFLLVISGGSGLASASMLWLIAMRADRVFLRR